MMLNMLCNKILITFINIGEKPQIPDVLNHLVLRNILHKPKTT